MFQVHCSTSCKRLLWPSDHLDKIKWVEFLLLLSISDCVFQSGNGMSVLLPDRHARYNNPDTASLFLTRVQCRARAEKVRCGGVEQEISLALRSVSSALVFNLAFSNYPGASQPKVHLAEVHYAELKRYNEVTRACGFGSMSNWICDCISLLNGLWFGFGNRSDQI